MGCCISTKDLDPAHDEIERRMKEEQKKDKLTRKLLLLGAGSSGKSTLLKQMKYLYVHHKGFPEEESMRYKHTVFNNIIQVIHVLCNAARALGVETEPANDEHIERVSKIDPIFESLDIEDIREEILACWNDRGIQKTFQRRHEFTVLDNAPYFMNNLDRLLHTDYVPTFDDVVRTRTKTTGIIHEDFYYDASDGGGEKYQICDVGGQRTERQKWIQCFDDVLAVIFVIALSGYNQVLYEDATMNRFAEAFQLFHDTTRIESFKKINFVVFLNKKDIFYEKIKVIPFTESFELAQQEYRGDPHDAEEVIEWVKDKIQERDVHNITYFHVTEATDSENINTVFSFCHDIILRDALNRGGLI